jgi:hypothetical protein
MNKDKDKFFNDRGYVVCGIKYNECFSFPIKEEEDIQKFAIVFFGKYNSETQEYEPAPEEMWQEYWKEFLPW